MAIIDEIVDGRTDLVFEPLVARYVAPGNDPGLNGVFLRRRLCKFVLKRGVAANRPPPDSGGVGVEARTGGG